MRISDWSSDLCSSDLQPTLHSRVQFPPESKGQERPGRVHVQSVRPDCGGARFVKAAGRRSSAWSCAARVPPSHPVRQHKRPPMQAPREARRFPMRSEEHTSELQSLMRISYAVFCLKKKNNKLTY